MHVPNIRGAHIVGNGTLLCSRHLWEALRGSCTTGLSSQQLMEKGRKEMKAQDDSLIRAQRIVESTIEVGRPQLSASLVAQAVLLCRSRCSTGWTTPWRAMS